jgi:hypothetical protein
VSVLVVAQSSSEIPEGLMNNPVSTGNRSKTYRGYVKPWTIPNAIYNVIFV